MYVCLHVHVTTKLEQQYSNNTLNKDHGTTHDNYTHHACTYTTIQWRILLLLNCGRVPPFPSREVLPSLLVVQAEVEFTLFGKDVVD